MFSFFKKKSAPKEAAPRPSGMFTGSAPAQPEEQDESAAHNKEAVEQSHAVALEDEPDYDAQAIDQEDLEKAEVELEDDAHQAEDITLEDAENYLKEVEESPVYLESPSEGGTNDSQIDSEGFVAGEGSFTPEEEENPAEGDTTGEQDSADTLSEHGDGVEELVESDTDEGEELPENQPDFDVDEEFPYDAQVAHARAVMAAEYGDDDPQFSTGVEVIDDFLDEQNPEEVSSDAQIDSEGFVSGEGSFTPEEEENPAEGDTVDSSTLPTAEDLEVAQEVKEIDISDGEVLSEDEPQKTEEATDLSIVDDFYEELGIVEGDDSTPAAIAEEAPSTMGDTNKEEEVILDPQEPGKAQVIAYDQYAESGEFSAHLEQELGGRKVFVVDMTENKYGYDIVPDSIVPQFATTEDATDVSGIIASAARTPGSAIAVVGADFLGQNMENTFPQGTTGHTIAVDRAVALVEQALAQGVDVYAVSQHSHPMVSEVERALNQEN